MPQLLCVLPGTVTQVYSKCIYYVSFSLVRFQASSSAEVMQFKFGLAQLSPASACMTSAGACPASATATIAASASATLKDNVKAENDSETGGCPSGNGYF